MGIELGWLILYWGIRNINISFTIQQTSLTIITVTIKGWVIVFPNLKPELGDKPAPALAGSLPVQAGTDSLTPVLLLLCVKEALDLW